MDNENLQGCRVQRKGGHRCQPQGKSRQRLCKNGKSPQRCSRGRPRRRWSCRRSATSQKQDLSHHPDRRGQSLQLRYLAEHRGQRRRICSSSFLFYYVVRKSWISSSSTKGKCRHMLPRTVHTPPDVAFTSFSQNVRLHCGNSNCTSTIMLLLVDSYRRFRRCCYFHYLADTEESK